MFHRRLVSGALLLAGVIGCEKAGNTPAVDPQDGATEAFVTVRTELAKRDAMSETLEALGRCEALPDHIATLTPAVEGHVHELFIKQGDPVKKGEPIVALDETVARADLAEKTAIRDGLKASLAVLKSLPRLEERAPSELAVEQARVAIERAQAVVEGLQALRGNNLTSKQQLFDAEKALEAARVQRKTAEATLLAMMIGPRPEAVAEAEGRIKTADAVVAFSRAHYDFHTIRAPIDGTLDSLMCRIGQTIAIGTPIGEVVDTRQVFASVWLTTRSAFSIRVGQAARVLPADAGDSSAEASDEKENGMAGKVTFVGQVADPQTGNLPIRILVENPQRRLTLGQSVRVSITVDERKETLQVPAVAILDLGEGPVLNVVRDGKSVVLHPEVSTPHGGWVAVSGTDLKEGESVIVEGGYNLPEGTRVNGLASKTVAQAEAEARP
jgi:HlyD family secretion protein